MERVDRSVHAEPVPDTGASSEARDGSHAPSAPAACLNCGAALAGPFCASCGQRDIPPYPSVRELASDAFAELSGWDGRVATTVRTLLRRPGMLTREFLAGRRARYISPVRLYLAASLVYFVLAAAAPEVTLESGETLRTGLRVDTRTGGAGGARPAELTEEDRRAMLDSLAGAPAVMRPFLRRVVEDPDGFRRAIIETTPRMFFVLLPAFAGIVALFYRGRKYPEHLYFAVHLHAFVFLVLAAVELLQFTRLAALVALASVVSLVWIPVHATFAFRGVYGGSLTSTLGKEAAIALVYGALLLLGFVAVVYWVSVFG